MSSNIHRYAVLCVTLVSMTMLIGNSVLFNFTVICMDPSERAGNALNATRFYTAEEEGWLMAAPPIGLILGSLPVIFLTDRIGMRISFSITVVVSGMSTLIFPFSTGSPFLACFIRFLQLGPTSAIPSSALFCASTVGWPGVYYLFGLLTLLAFLGFSVIYRNAPNANRTRSTVQVLPAPTTSAEATSVKSMPPYWTIFTSASVWGIFSTGIGDSLAFLVFFFYGPIYVNKVRGVISLTIFIDLALMTLNMILLTTLAADSPIIAEVLIVLTVALAGLHFIAMMSASQIVAQQYTHVISSAMAALESVFGLLLPPFVSLLAPNHTADEWARVFYCIIVFLIATNVIFAAITTLKPAQWTKVDVGIQQTEMEHVRSE
uniref:MFS domain-containing protein n=1 Tax=Steinernema glaseri TaxID=37863 RepID=A0A1I7YT60_9BILA